jgi:hypothetical protein
MMTTTTKATAVMGWFTVINFGHCYTGRSSSFSPAERQRTSNKAGLSVDSSCQFGHKAQSPNRYRIFFTNDNHNHHNNAMQQQPNDSSRHDDDDDDDDNDDDDDGVVVVEVVTVTWTNYKVRLLLLLLQLHRAEGFPKLYSTYEEPNVVKTNLL